MPDTNAACNTLYYEEKFKNLDDKLDGYSKRLCTLQDDLTELDKSFSVYMEGTNLTLERLINLPENIEKLTVSCKEMRCSMENLHHGLDDTNSKLSAVQNDIVKIDEEGKFNIRLWLKNNWVSILLALSALAATGAAVLK